MDRPEVPYSVRVQSDLGYKDHNFDNLDAALDGMTTLVLEGIKLKDGVERWYRIFITPTEEERSRDVTWINDIEAQPERYED